MESKVISVRVDLDLLERINSTADCLYSKSYTGQPNRSQLFLDSLKLFCELAEMGKFDNINMRSLSADAIVNSVDKRNHSNEELVEAIKQELLPEIIKLLGQRQLLNKQDSITQNIVEPASTVNSVYNQAKMNLDKALELAKSRGFTGNKKTFSNSFTKNKKTPDYRFHGIGRIPQGKGKPALFFDDK